MPEYFEKQVRRKIPSSSEPQKAKVDIIKNTTKAPTRAKQNIDQSNVCRGGNTGQVK